MVAFANTFRFFSLLIYPLYPFGKGKLDFFSTLDLGKELYHDAQALKHISLVVLPLTFPKLKKQSGTVTIKWFFLI